MQKKIWHKVAEELSLQVSLGKWPVGSIIPGEIELAQQYCVSRDTMRKALAHLTTQGLFERKAHVGTRVKSRTRTGKFLNEVDDIRQIDHYGNLYPRHIQNIERIKIDEETADRLNLLPGEEAIKFKNIRVASEKYPEAVVVTFVYIYPNALEILDLIKKRNEDLIITLAEEVTGQECVEVKQTFSATAMPKEVAEIFHVPEGSPSLKIIRNYYDSRGLSIVASESFHLSDRFSFSVRSKKKP